MWGGGVKEGCGGLLKAGCSYESLTFRSADLSPEKKRDETKQNPCKFSLSQTMTTQRRTDANQRINIPRDCSYPYLSHPSPQPPSLTSSQHSCLTESPARGRPGSCSGSPRAPKTRPVVVELCLSAEGAPTEHQPPRVTFPGYLASRGWYKISPTLKIRVHNR